MSRRLLAALVAACAAPSATLAAPDAPTTIEDVFSERAETQLVLTVEGALAVAQGRHGVIPRDAARAICRAADADAVSPADFDAEYEVVRHRMVAMLNVWRRAMPEDAGNYTHYGATTVDIYDTTLMLQLHASTVLLIEDLSEIQRALIELAETYRDTPMIGRTLGQHALPITFGKKVAVWIDETGRNIARLRALQERIERSAIMKGAVGTYVGLGDEAVDVEASFADALGMAAPYPADWHPARDVVSDYALTLSLVATSWARFGQEVFLLQSTDIGEVTETRPATAVSSSTMPHKNNPSLSEALIHYGRTVPALADVVAADGVNFFERDNTSRPNRDVATLSIEAEAMLRDAGRLVARLDVDEAAMRANLDRTDGLILSQRLVFALAPTLGREHAETRIRDIAAAAIDAGTPFRDALLADPEIAGALTADEIDALLDPTTYLGGAGVQVDRTVAEARRALRDDVGPAFPVWRVDCPRR